MSDDLATRLWDRTRSCFETDDGSLPGIVIERLSPAGVAAVYAMLRRRSRLHNGDAAFWSRADAAEQPLDFVSNAAALVAADEAEAFHFCIEGLETAGTELPVLGVYVWREAVELDYKMGSDWGPAQVVAFFELLRECCELDRAAVIVPADSEGPPDPDRFRDAWAWYQQSRNPPC